MARVVKKPEVRRNEIIDVAQGLFLTKGYENTSVQDVLDGAGIAKGTFYHYFSSKMELLDAYVSRLTDDILAMVEPIVRNEQMSAIDKLRNYFDSISQWKTENRRHLMDVVRVIYHDDNTVYREKMMQVSVKRIAPVLATIIQQGVDEGVFNTKYVPEIAEIIYVVIRTQGESLVALLLDETYEGDMAAEFERVMQAHEYAIAAILGYDGELKLIDVDAVKLWIDVSEASTRR